jgi:hypothetical protein
VTARATAAGLAVGDRLDGLAGAGLSGAELTVLGRAEWPGPVPRELPTIAGFVLSSFSPLAAVLADDCLRGCFGDPPGPSERAADTAIVLASATGDIGTAAAVSQAVDAGRRVPPLLFYQGNPNAVAGHIAARWGLAGPVSCTIPAGDALADALTCGLALIGDGEATAALIISASQGGIGTGHQPPPGSGSTADGYGDADHGTALLIGPAAWRAAVPA